MGARQSSPWAKDMGRELVCMSFSPFPQPAYGNARLRGGWHHIPPLQERKCAYTNKMVWSSWIGVQWAPVMTKILLLLYILHGHIGDRSPVYLGTLGIFSAQLEVTAWSIFEAPFNVLAFVPVLFIYTTVGIKSRFRPDSAVLKSIQRRLFSPPNPHPLFRGASGDRDCCSLYRHCFSARF